RIHRRKHRSLIVSRNRRTHDLTLPAVGGRLSRNLPPGKKFESAPLARPPLQEFLEQPVALLRRQCGGLFAPAHEELLELVALGLRRGIAAQPLLRALEALPARQHRGEVRLAPFRMARGSLEFGELREEIVDELLDAAVTIRALRPVERD